jgi:cation diffusion facilitator CzcD-associated flavoprotein CzcO
MNSNELTAETLVIGAGFGGMYAIHKYKSLGNVICVEKGR